MKIIICITGTISAGKDTVADYLKEKYSFQHFSLSDEIRLEATKRGIEHVRQNLMNLGNELRKDFGPAVLAERTLERINSSNTDRSVITSIRNPFEVEALKKSGDFKLIVVDAPIDLRYERALKRGRAGDGTSLDDFRQAEERELRGGANEQQLLNCFALADKKIINDGDMELLNKKIDEILKNNI